jgi:hypothetical protein
MLSEGLLMSALGQKRTFCWAAVMSALPPKADIASTLMSTCSSDDARRARSAVDARPQVSALLQRHWPAFDRSVIPTMLFKRITGITQ